tara:strand:- start:1638 stop:2453 length:816 start_codon:yes stop_codon:yes gene_type:complete
MAVPSTRTNFKEWCLRSLGKPVIEINVDPDQVEDRIDEALQYFSQYHYDGVERVYLKYQVTQADIDRARSDNSLASVTDIDNTTTAVWKEQKNYIPVPSSVMSIVKVFPMTDKSSTGMFDIRYQLRLNDLYDFSSTSVIHYEMTMQHLDFLDHILVGETAIRHNQHQNRLYLDADFQQDFADGDYILIECYRNLDPSTYPDVWNDIFLKKYCTQLIKKQWGANLSKFQGIQMLGGVSLNGEQIYTQAQEEIDKLEEQIQLAYELPPMHMIG